MKWEYKLVVMNNAFRDNPYTFRKDVERKFNRLGEEGWEIVSFEGVLEFVLLKRPKIIE